MITDMIRATIIIQTPKELQLAYKKMESFDNNIKIVKIKNKLSEQLKNITLNIVYFD